MPKLPKLKSQAAELAELTAFAHQLADASGVAIRPHFRKRLAVANKAAAGGYDPVTVADRQAERVITRLVRERYPDHGLEGEEFGLIAADANWRWIIDPIDGTRAFVTGMPTWGTLIGLTAGGAPMLGVMDQPFTGERFWSEGKAAWFRGPDGERRRIKTRACASLEDAVLTTTHPELFGAGHEMRRFLKVKERVRMCRYGGDCYSYCMLAAGHIDLVVEAGLKSYDVAALIPIVERAGGLMTTWDGGPAAGGGRVVASGDARIHEAALALLGR